MYTVSFGTRTRNVSPNRGRSPHTTSVVAVSGNVSDPSAIAFGTTCCKSSRTCTMTL